MPDSAREPKGFLRSLEHEDELIGIRLGWLIAAEAFLFVAYAAALTVSEKPGRPRFVAAADRLVTWLPIFGLVLAVLVYVSILAAISVFFLLRREWLSGGRRDEAAEFDLGEFWLWLGFSAPLLVPPLIIAAWVFISVAQG